MDACNAYFRLDHAPFSERKRSAVLATAPLRSAISRIRADIAVGVTQICVSGPSGVGKTSLSRALPGLLRRSASVAGVARISDPSANWPEVRRQIARQLRLSSETLSRDSLLAACGANRRLVLLVDSAHRLSYELLDHLESLLRCTTSRGEPLFCCILFADLEADLAHEEGAPRSRSALKGWLDPVRTIHVELEALPADGVRGYVHQSLKMAGWELGTLFTEDAIEAIHTLTGGLPRAVNTLCDRSLREACARNAALIDSRIVVDALTECAEAGLGSSAGPAIPVAAESRAPAHTPSKSQNAPAEPEGIETEAAADSEPAPVIACTTTLPDLAFMPGTEPALLQVATLPADAPRDARAASWIVAGLALALLVAALLVGVLQPLQKPLSPSEPAAPAKAASLDAGAPSTPTTSAFGAPHSASSPASAFGASQPPGSPAFGVSHSAQSATRPW